MTTVDEGFTQKKSAALDNSFRLAAMAQRLSILVMADRRLNTDDLYGFSHCCISLAKGFDFAIANNEIPARVQGFPLLLKKVCQHRRDHDLIHAAVMVMMISVKNACHLGWFSQTESQELLALADEISNGFNFLGDSRSNQKSRGDLISQIMERFYPFLKLGQILVSLDVEPGYKVLTSDFHISKQTRHPSQHRIRLFVAQTDNIETSSCIINPPEVSFLLNGKMVDKRAIISMDSGPQIPTNVTGMLKYGTNLLQVIGNFKGHYIIILAFTGVIPPSETRALKDYVPSGVIESNSDADLIEGPSRISLNCPISHTRIKLPVKGHLCKHLQCFDFWNYVNINMRKPSWRCPHCNQSVCCTDVRIDRTMVQVLKEAGDDVADVMISAGGSWKIVMEDDENMKCVDETIHDQEDPMSLLNSGPVILDLTGDDDDAEIAAFCETETEDRKPLSCSNQGQFSNYTSRDEDLSSMLLNSNGLLPDPSGSGQDVTIARHSLPFQTPSLQDRPSVSSSVFSSSIASHTRPSFITPVYNTMGRTSNLVERWRPFFANSSQLPPLDHLPSQNRMHPIRSLSQSPSILRQLRLAHSQEIHGPNYSRQAQFVSNDLMNGQRLNQGGPVAQAVSRACDLMDQTVAGTTATWRPHIRMRGSLVPGSYPAELDHMIIRPTQQSQAQTSRPGQTPQGPAQNGTGSWSMANPGSGLADPGIW